PPVIANLTDVERRELVWYRLRYRLVDAHRSSFSIKNGIISLSQIMPDLFHLRVATSHIAREGLRYSARVQARHPFTHRPAANVHIAGEITIDADEELKPTASATTGKDGYAYLNFVLPPTLPPSPMGSIRITGTCDGVVAKVEEEIRIDKWLRILITTDKALYQPGQTMHVRALMFGASKRAQANQNIYFRIVDPEGVNVFVTEARTSRFGVGNADWQIPDNVRLGDYRIQVGREDEEHQNSIEIRISRYELPNFTVSVEPDRKFYLPGQNAKVKVRADYLFGQQVKRGRVRVVEETSREWNYREQKWDIDEGARYEGETNGQGEFDTNIELASEHEELADNDYEEFKDLTFAAYFTDPTTNRTEQRRFSLRITKESIHVYISGPYYSYQNRNLPLQVYVSTYYADGSPARCTVNFSLTTGEEVSPEEKRTTSRRKRTIRTNRYGLAKTNIRIDDDFIELSSLWLKALATDANGRSGSDQERFRLDDDSIVLVDTEKSLYRAGEPLVASITSTLPDQTLIVELAKDSSVVRSERVRLRGGRATVTFPYAANYAGRFTLAAYPDFADTGQLVGLRSVMYPRNPELTVNVRPSQASYRPGEDASVRLNVKASDGSAAASALGVVVSDKAVEERMRTDAEFSGGYQPYNQTVNDFLGLTDQLSGVTVRDLQRLDMTKVVPPDLDLLAEILLNYNRNYYPLFYGGDEYETELPKVFAKLINPQVQGIGDALHARYLRTGQYPNNEATLREFLREAQIDFQSLADPWGMPYLPLFTIEGRVDVLTLMCGGADKRFGTADDFSVMRRNWEYFPPLGKTIQAAVETYHQRTKGFIRDRETLRQELARSGLSLDQVRDRWGQPYRYDFTVKEMNYVIEVNSSGPDRRFATESFESPDDFTIWSAQIDYFAEPRAVIEKTLSEKLTSTGKFPQSDLELREALRGSEQPFEMLRDPWNRSYYPIFKTESVYADRVEIENRAALGNRPTTQTRIFPVTRTTAQVILKSPGEDGQEGTVDDFAVATFSQIIREEARGTSQVVPVAVVLSGGNGAIHGVVTDPNGAVIPNAKITATRAPDIHRYHALSDENGAYVLKDLPPGLYEVHFESPGFVRTVITNVQVGVSSVTQLNAMLQVGPVVDAVNVSAGPSNLEMTTTSAVSRTIGRPGLKGTTSPALAQISTPRLREYFPETLVWQPSIETDERGRAEVKFKLADNITTWKMAVIGSTEDGRIGTAEMEFKAFQPFFVEHDPPRVLTEGDEISLPVVVRNYLDRVQKVDLELKPESWFSLLGAARKQTSVAAGDAARQTFDFRTISSVADGPQRITAFGSDANDAIEKPITVHPDGEELSVTTGDILNSSAAL
ncbi:MAG TPA: MG2 domain-containing protein, partial [Pyrinomonadaceae bacterium]|nr:MG2 domain-containing protein [Pyrinomonadaceae bacterium]